MNRRRSDFYDGPMPPPLRRPRQLSIPGYPRAQTPDTNSGWHSRPPRHFGGGGGRFNRYPRLVRVAAVFGAVATLGYGGYRVVGTTDPSALNPIQKLKASLDESRRHEVCVVASTPNPDGGTQLIGYHGDTGVFQVCVRPGLRVALNSDLVPIIPKGKTTPELEPRTYLDPKHPGTIALEATLTDTRYGGTPGITTPIDLISFLLATYIKGTLKGDLVNPDGPAACVHTLDALETDIRQHASNFAQVANKAYGVPAISVKDLTSDPLELYSVGFDTQGSTRTYGQYILSCTA